MVYSVRLDTTNWTNEALHASRTMRHAHKCSRLGRQTGYCGSEGSTGRVGSYLWKRHR